MEIIPFEGLQIISTVADEKQIAILLDESGAHYLMCDGCDGTSFVVEAIIKAELDVSFGKPDKQIIVRERTTTLSAMVLRIIRCATCNSTDFIRERTEITNYVSKTKRIDAGEDRF